MRFLNILQALYCEPWLLSPDRHRVICQIVEDHISGAAHAAGGRLDDFRAGDHNFDEQREQLDRVLTIEEGIAFIKVNGVMGRNLGLLAESSGAIGTDTIENAIVTALNDPAVEGIILDFDSPGGSVIGVPELADSVASARFDKPVVSFTGGLMASSAYWVAVGADAIVATGSSIVGAIGIYSAFIDQSRAFEMAGLKTEVFKTGKFKAMGIQGTSLTDEQREMIQAEVDDIFVDFTASILFNREIPNEAMQGQSFNGNTAKAQGLVDVVGNMDTAIEELRAIIEAKAEA